MTEVVGKATILISAVYANGVPAIDDEKFVADVFERKTAPGKGVTVLANAVPTKLAPVIRAALTRKAGVSLLIEGLTPPTEETVA